MSCNMPQGDVRPCGTAYEHARVLRHAFQNAESGVGDPNVNIAATVVKLQDVAAGMEKEQVVITDLTCSRHLHELV